MASTSVSISHLALLFLLLQLDVLPLGGDGAPTEPPSSRLQGVERLVVQTLLLDRRVRGRQLQLPVEHLAVPPQLALNTRRLLLLRHGELLLLEVEALAPLHHIVVVRAQQRLLALAVPAAAEAEPHGLDLGQRGGGLGLHVLDA